MDMVTVIVKSIWKGKVAVNSKYVDEAILSWQNLLIRHDHEGMVLGPDQIPGKIIKESLRVYQDKFTGQKYALTYFVWKPNAPLENQPPLPL